MSRELVDASCADTRIENEGFVLHEAGHDVDESIASHSNWPLVDDTDPGDSASVVKEREVVCVAPAVCPP
jgi:hypothetical protein